jgi:hypothetical protein
MMPFVAQPISPTELLDAQKLLDDAGLGHWIVSEIRGHGGDASLFRAERVAGQRTEVAHAHPESLLALVREVEVRSPSRPVAVTEDGLDTSSYTPEKGR